MRENLCKACEGTGMLADDEGWQYHCTICRGVGTISKEKQPQPVKVLAVDDNNRILD